MWPTKWDRRVFWIGVWMFSVGATLSVFCLLILFPLAALRVTPQVMDYVLAPAWIGVACMASGEATLLGLFAKDYAKGHV